MHDGRQLIANNISEKNIKKRLVFWDETLRDGEQTPGVAFSIDQKIELVKMIDEIGVQIIDAGFPAVSKDEQLAIRKISSLDTSATIGVTVRAKISDIDLAIKCGVKTVFIFAPTSQLHITCKFGSNYENLKSMITETIKYAMDYGLEIYFISEDTSRSDMSFIISLFDEIYELGVDKIMLTDTVSVMLPVDMKEFTGHIINACNPGITFGIHCHNDFGLATANTLAAIEAGAVYTTATINGIGERAGNASMEEIICAIEFIYKCKTGISLHKLKELSEKVSMFSGIPIAPNKAIVGFNAFRHESGIHTSAMLKELQTYEVISPEAVGQKRDYILGKHTGKALVEHWLRQYEIDYKKDDMNSFLSIVKENNDKYSKQKEKFFYQTIEYYKQCLGMSTRDSILKFFNGQELHPLEVEACNALLNA